MTQEAGSRWGADDEKGAVNLIDSAVPRGASVHQRLISVYRIALLEGAMLKPLADAGATTCLFVAAPLSLGGGTGSPLTSRVIL